MASSTKTIAYGTWTALSAAGQSGTVCVNDSAASRMVAVDHGASSATCAIAKSFLLDYSDGNDRALKITKDDGSDIYYATRISPGNDIKVVVDVI